MCSRPAAVPRPPRRQSEDNVRSHSETTLDFRVVHDAAQLAPCRLERNLESLMSKTRPQVPADYGLSYLLWLCVVIVFLITINGGIVDLFMSGWIMDRPVWLEDQRVLMAIGKIAPFLILICEYWVLDFFVDRYRSWRARSSTEIS